MKRGLSRSSFSAHVCRDRWRQQSHVSGFATKQRSSMAPTTLPTPPDHFPSDSQQGYMAIITCYITYAQWDCCDVIPPACASWQAKGGSRRMSTVAMAMGAFLCLRPAQ